MVEISSLVGSRIRKKDRTGLGMMSYAEEVVLLGVSQENQLFLKRKVVRCLEGDLLASMAEGEENDFEHNVFTQGLLVSEMYRDNDG